MSETQITPASEWRRAAIEGELVRLPGSGNVARLVRPSLLALAATANGVPNPFTADVQRLITGTAPPKDDAERWAAYVGNSRAYKEVAALCFKEPRLILDRPPTDNEIGPNDLTDWDYIWIYNRWVEGAATEVAPFRVVVGAQANGSASAALWRATEPVSSD